MLFRSFVADDCFPQTIDVLKTRSAPLGIELVIGDPNSFLADENFFGAVRSFVFFCCFC